MRALFSRIRAKVTRSLNRTIVLLHAFRTIGKRQTNRFEFFQDQLPRSTFTQRFLLLLLLSFHNFFAPPSLPLEFSTSLPKAERRIPFAESKAAINVEISTKLFVGSPRYTERRYLIGREEAHPLASSPRSRTPAREIPEDRFERARLRAVSGIGPLNALIPSPSLLFQREKHLFFLLPLSLSTFHPRILVLGIPCFGQKNLSISRVLLPNPRSLPSRGGSAIASL